MKVVIVSRPLLAVPEKVSQLLGKLSPQWGLLAEVDVYTVDYATVWFFGPPEHPKKGAPLLTATLVGETFLVESDLDKKETSDLVEVTEFVVKSIVSAVRQRAAEAIGGQMSILRDFGIEVPQGLVSARDELK